VNARIFTIGPDHPLHPLQATARAVEASWLRRVRSAGTFELLQLRGAHLRMTGEHDEDTCWRCVALVRAHARK
jgi:hypothetical protein